MKHTNITEFDISEAELVRKVVVTYAKALGYGKEMDRFLTEALAEFAKLSNEPMVMDDGTFSTSFTVVGTTVRLEQSVTIPKEDLEVLTDLIVSKEVLTVVSSVVGMVKAGGAMLRGIAPLFEGVAERGKTAFSILSKRIEYRAWLKGQPVMEEGKPEVIIFDYFPDLEEGEEVGATISGYIDMGDCQIIAHYNRGKGPAGFIATNGGLVPPPATLTELPLVSDYSLSVEDIISMKVYGKLDAYHFTAK